MSTATDSAKAVFLSYASQDAQAAKQLCHALRAAGVEVWFDQSELRGGDVWDASIRRQIKECALFIPVISRNTHARDEGYFRLEWKLAVDRSHLMAGNRTFLLPVVVDDTSDQDDRVPDRFREVQWTRLPGGTDADGFVERVRRLLTHERTVSAPISHGSPSTPASLVDASSSAPSIRSTERKPRSFVPWIVGGLSILASGYFIADKFLRQQHVASAAQALPAVPVQAEAVSDKSIAVLPFADMSEKKDQEYFSDGLAEELIEQLGKTPGLKVIARTSAFSFKGKSDDIPTIASKLKVANVLEGSVRRFGKQLRVTTQLIRADSGQPLWSETFDREFKDVFKIQDEIAAAVVGALKLKLTGGQLAAGHGTTNPEAYDAFLLARKIYLQATTEAEFRNAVEAYQRVISLDPRYADAYAELALAQYYVGDDTGDVALEHSAEQMAQKAIDLDPRRASGYTVRGILRYLIRFDWVGAEADFQQALALDPTDNRVLGRYAGMLINVGRFQEAEAMVRKAIAHDPLDANTRGTLGTVLAASGKYSAAYEAFSRARALSPEADSWKGGLAQLQLVDGKTLEARATYQELPFDAYRDSGVAMAEHSLGHTKASQQALEKMIAESAALAAYQIAEVYAWRGEKDQAFEWLEKAYRQQDGGLPGIKADPLFTSLRSDPRYAAILRKLNLSP